MIAGKRLHPGSARGIVLKLEEPVSFWGGVSPTSGLIVDRSHPQVGSNVAGKIVAMPGSRGSSGTPGVLGELLRRGTGPIAILLTKPDVNVVTGALVAMALYGSSCPIVLIDQATFDGLSTGDRSSV